MLLVLITFSLFKLKKVVARIYRQRGCFHAHRRRLSVFFILLNCLVVNSFIFISKVVNLIGLIIGSMPDSSFGECPGYPLKIPTLHRFRSTGGGGGVPPG